MMSESWDKRQVLEAEAEKINALTNMEAIQNPELVKAKTSQMHSEARKADAEATKVEAEAEVQVQEARTTGFKALGTVVGRAVVVHVIWGVVILGVTYIVGVMSLGIIYGR